MPDEERSEEEQAPRRPRVVDKRISARAAAGEEPAPAPSAPTPPEPEGSVASSADPPPSAPSAQQVWTPEQEEEARRMAEEIARTPSLDWIVNAAVTLANVAGTKLQIGSAEDAQVAIDAFAGILDSVGPALKEAEAPLRQTLAQLQMMYAERVAGVPQSPPTG